MNPFVLFAWAAFGLTVAAGVGIIIVVVVAARRERWQWDARAVAAERMIERNRARSPRHATAASKASGAGRTQKGLAAQLPDVPVLPRTSRYVTAADLRPVIVPTPFGQPQPRSAGTETFERVPTDTGELRALTDAYLHGLRYREEQYRKELTP